MEKISSDSILDIAKFLTDFECSCSIRYCLELLLLNKSYRSVIIKYFEKKKEKCYKKQQFIDDLKKTGVFNKPYPENYGFPSGTLDTLISQLPEWDCMTRISNDIIISEIGKKEWWYKIINVCRNLANANKTNIYDFSLNKEKTITLHANTPQELTKLLELMDKFGLCIKYRSHICCSGKGLTWKL